MTQRSGKFTRGPCVFDDISRPNETDGLGYIYTADRGCGGPTLAHTGDSDLPAAENRANAALYAAAHNAATIAEDFGYDGQAAVEALPEILRGLWRIGYEPQGNPEASHSGVLTKCEDIARALLNAIKTKEPTS
jgi:hypothetical protein